MRAAARPSVRLIAALLHATCVLVGPGLHLSQVGACGCGQPHARQPEREQVTCGHGQCCHHGDRHGHAASDRASEDVPGDPSPAPAHDPDHCPVCQQLGLARIAAPAVRLTIVAVDAPLVSRPLPTRRPLLIAAAVLCRGPPCSAADV